MSIVSPKRKTAEVTTTLDSTTALTADGWCWWSMVHVISVVACTCALPVGGSRNNWRRAIFQNGGNRALVPLRVIDRRSSVCRRQLSDGTDDCRKCLVSVQFIFSPVATNKLTSISSSSTFFFFYQLQHSCESTLRAWPRRWRAWRWTPGCTRAKSREPQAYEKPSRSSNKSTIQRISCRRHCMPWAISWPAAPSSSAVTDDFMWGKRWRKSSESPRQTG